MGEGVALLLGQPGCFCRRIVIVAGHQHHFAAVAAGGFDLEDRRAFRHADDGVDAESCRGQRHTLGVVAGGTGDDALRRFLRRQIADLVEGAPDLEGAGLLQVFGFDV